MNDMYRCPDCGKILQYSKDECVYKCVCGYFEDWEVVEGNREAYDIGIPLESIIRGKMLDNQF